MAYTSMKTPTENVQAKYLSVTPPVPKKKAKMDKIRPLGQLQVVLCLQNNDGNPSSAPSNAATSRHVTSEHWKCV